MSSNWITRVESGADIPIVHEINSAAFTTTDEAHLVDALRDDPHWIPELSIVATDELGIVMGCALLTRCHIGETPALCLGPCAVWPQHQRTGAGSAAIESALLRARNRGEKYVVVLGHPSYYPRFGFGRASVHGIRLSIDVPDDALMAMSLDGSPLPGGQVRYAAPFGI
ncbi:putative N-acetyltransferase YhbS [Prauserella isguenensis]|uniref:Putative N-acetyltransferase YhbS n=1 Tax=Prauserella isguenensis TaxID=1470180 RepID=A0A839S5D9_9PSEU|nr:N-acetyltransferase [Prauserella isguenensis]MBB3052602.1 putative N-acetyltransferase YhbS [Prauserella isguenensis]